MDKLFGLSMSSIAGVLSALLLVVIFCLGLLALRRPVFFKLGLRPRPRRRAQSTLIVLGLMLATLIITAAFVTGDTLSHSIRTVAIEGMGEIDEMVQASSAGYSLPYFKINRYDDLAAQLKGYALVDRVLPALMDSAPVVNVTHRRSLRSIGVIGMRPEDVSVLPAAEVSGADGRLMDLNALGAGEVYLNLAAGKELDAAPGDTLEIYAGANAQNFTVRAISGQGDNPRVLMHLRQAQHLYGQNGRINLIIVSNVGDSLSGVQHSQAVTAHLRELMSDPKVAQQIFTLLAHDRSAAQTLRAAAEEGEGNTQADLLALASGLDSGRLTPETRSLLADEGLAGRVQALLTDAQWGSERQRDRLASLYGDLSELAVSDTKRDTLDQGDMAASAFTTIFIVAGLFGITAGLVLIFLIFIMLAAERKSEMGMARAVGAQRGHMVEMFVFEGTAYDLGAAFVGVALGVGMGLIIAFTLGRAFGGVGLDLVPNVSPRSLVVSFSLGMLVTFFTVLVSANRVSHLNIVSAIRDLPEPPRPATFLRDRLLAPLRAVADTFRHLFHLKPLRALRSCLFGLPGSLLRLVWLGFTGGPFTLLLGLALVPAGLQSASAALVGTGVSFIIIGAMLIVRGLLGGLLRRLARGKTWNPNELRDRISYSTMGLLLTLYWALPGKVLEKALRLPELSGGAEMLFVSGVLIVSGAVLVIMYNTDLILRLVLLVLGRSPRFAPVLRMAIAYPLSNRFRTGMTIAIFAVVMFSVIFMATLFKVNEIVLTDTEQYTSGFDLRVSYSSHNPVKNLPRAIQTRPSLRADDYAVVAGLVTVPLELKQEGGARWSTYILQAGDDAYLANTDYAIGVLGEGYTSAAQVWETVRTRPGYAVIDRLAVPSHTTTSYVIGGPSFSLKGVYLEDETMKPIQVEARDPATGATFKVTVIGVLEQTAILGYGMITSQETVEKGLGAALPEPAYYIRLAEGAQAGPAGAALESAFLKNGLESTDLVKELRDSMAMQLLFQQLMLGFLTVGLVVGVAALGVISTRAVVERRQQIGMLRALGFQRQMISWIFLLESSFVSLLGIGLGAGLALIPASQMITDMAVDIPGLTFQVPWVEILLVSGLAYIMTLLTTWLPAAQASKITPAEALRYE